MSVYDKFVKTYNDLAEINDKPLIKNAEEETQYPTLEELKDAMSANDEEIEGVEGAFMSIQEHLKEAIMEAEKLYGEQLPPIVANSLQKLIESMKSCGIDTGKLMEDYKKARVWEK